MTFQASFLILLLSLSLVIGQFNSTNELEQDSPRRNGSDSYTDDNIIEIFNDCACVWYYLCDDDNYVITTGRGLFTERSHSNKSAIHRIKCSQPTHFCCRLRDKTGKVINPLIVTEPSEENVTTTEYPKTTTEVQETSREETGPKCGLQRLPFNPRSGVVGGKAALDWECPWTVLVLQRKKNGNSDNLKCLGSIIHSKVVLTAGHCVAGTAHNTFKIVAGLGAELNLREIGAGFYDYEVRTVTKIVKHPEYYSGTLSYDAALLFLNEPLKVDSAINAVCLPEGNRNFTSKDRGCWAAGWRENATFKDMKTLIKVQLPIVDRRQCETAMRTTRMGSRFTLDPSHLCAGGEKDKDLCTGSGGAPLVCSDLESETFVQAGIVSWGIDCGKEGIPGVYTDVAKLRGWIDEEIEAEEGHKSK